MFLGDAACERIPMLVQQRQKSVQHPGPTDWGHLRPGGKRRRGGRHGLLYDGGIRHDHLARHLPRCGVEHWLLAARDGDGLSADPVGHLRDSLGLRSWGTLARVHDAPLDGHWSMECESRLGGLS